MSQCGKPAVTIADLPRVIASAVLALFQFAFVIMFFVPGALLNFHNANVGIYVYTLIAIGLPLLLGGFFRLSRHGAADDVAIIVLTELAVLGGISMVLGQFVGNHTTFLGLFTGTMDIFGYALVFILIAVLIVLDYAIVAWWSRKFAK